jgi:hypothetical protein
VTQPEAYQNNLTHLQGELLTLNLRLHRQVLRWRATHHQQATPDELLGLYVSDREVDALLDSLYADSAPPEADALDQAPIATLSALLADAKAHHAERQARALANRVPLRLPTLARRLALDEFEQQIVLLALAPELDRRYERLFGFLNDDVTRRWPSVELSLRLFCSDLAERVVRRRALAPEAPLRELRVMHLVDEPGQSPSPLLAQGIRLDQRIVAYLLEHDAPDAQLTGLLRRHPASSARPVVNRTSEARVSALHAYLACRPAPAPILSISGPDPDLQIDLAAHLADGYTPGTILLVLDGAALSTHPAPEDVAARALREARLDNAALAVCAADVLQAGGGRAASALRRLTMAAHDQPRFLLAAEVWTATGLTLDAPLLSLRLPAPDSQARQRLWAALLDGRMPDVDLAELADRFCLTSRQIAAAASRAYAQAAVFGDNGRVQRSDLFASCRAESSTALSGLAECIQSIHTWDDLVLPPSIKSQLHYLEYWVRCRHIVYDEWGYDQRVMLGRGLAVLFSGPSGTGKTMAAGILARRLQLDLYRVDLSTVVSKYIGETEKNLSRIFNAAETANAILFFDEADALFGKRSEVKDAHDRYANIEVSYLLQRMEAYDGLAILATNFRQNLDQGFARRLHATIEFPFPQASDRERIWRRLLPGSVPQTKDIDLSYLAHQFALSGGNIKNCVLTAAFAAAAEGTPIAMRHLVQAVARELEKLERPIVRSEFGAHFGLLRSHSQIDGA